MPPRLVCFDLDGTLIPRTSVSLFMAERLGHSVTLQALEDRYRRGTISSAEIALASAAAYAGLPIPRIDRTLAEIPLIAGIEPTLAALSARGIRKLLTTVTWRFAAEAFQRRFGFDAVCGTEMSVCDGRLTGQVSRHCDEYGKLEFVRDQCRDFGIDLSECAAVGDSRSDIPLFRAVGLAIAFNASPDAAAAAHIAIETANLADILPTIGVDQLI
jgi:phosphoserine phosphatase